MNILVTGSKGFIGKNLVHTLKNIKDGKDNSFPVCVSEIYKYDKDSTLDDLKEYTKDCDFVVHLAGVNRPENNKEFYDGNKGTIELLCECLKENNNRCPVLVTSSVQVGKDNDYALSKKQGEEYINDFSKKQGNEVYIYRLANVFGKWCRPNYNSVVATWCYNIANDLDITVNDESTVIPFIYIDDVVSEIINCINGNPYFDEEKKYYSALPIYNVSLKTLKDTIYSFTNGILIPNLSDGFTKKLYSTYLSYLPKNKISIPLHSNIDDRGSFTELLKSKEFGQVSVNISKPGITKGEHWHHTKWEYFIVVKGKALIEMRQIDNNEVLWFEVSDEKFEAVHMLPGFTHNITNLSDTEELITVMWANEIFNKEKSDTFYEKVGKINE